MEGTAAQADFCFVHFTDTHIMAGGTLPNLDTRASLQRVIEVLTALEPRPAFAEVIADKFGVPFTLDNAEAYRQLLDYVQDRYENELQQQKPITPFRAALGSGDDATGIGICQHHNDAGSSDGRKAPPIQLTQQRWM